MMLWRQEREAGGELLQPGAGEGGDGEQQDAVRGEGGAHAPRGVARRQHLHRLALRLPRLPPRLVPLLFSPLLYIFFFL